MSRRLITQIIIIGDDYKDVKRTVLFLKEAGLLLHTVFNYFLLPCLSQSLLLVFLLYPLLTFVLHMVLVIISSSCFCFGIRLGAGSHPQVRAYPQPCSLYCSAVLLRVGIPFNLYFSMSHLALRDLRHSMIPKTPIIYLPSCCYVLCYLWFVLFIFHHHVLLEKCEPLAVVFPNAIFTPVLQLWGNCILQRE